MLAVLGVAAHACCTHAVSAQEVRTTELAKRAEVAQQRAVEFFSRQVAVEGGYVYQVSGDLQFREGEGDAGAKAVWVQPPGTPAVGMAYIEAYERTGDEYLLRAAKDAALCLLRGQLHSGGWQNHIDFDPELRGKLAYRVEGERRKKARNLSSFDDDQTQSAIRFLMKVDRVLEFKDAAIHEATEYALSSVVRNQFPNGAWSQVYEAPIDSAFAISKQNATRRGTYPQTWSRQFPGGDYWFFYTLNDQALVRVMQTMLLAHETYNKPEYREAALKAADFLIAAQMPEPQPAWAQQYNYEMEPVWARKFEPPAISGGESQVVIEAMLDLATLTGDKRYLKPIPAALAYLKKSVLPDGRLARFYELQTNRPLYFNRKYELTYDDSDMPTHYGFKVDNQLDQLSKRYEKLSGMTSQELVEFGKSEKERRQRAKPSAARVEKIIIALDARGAWVEPGKLRYVKQSPAERPVIQSQTFIKNLDDLSRFLAKPKP